MQIGIQNSELGQRGGINTYSSRLNRYLNQIPNVKSKMFIENYKNGKPDIISIQYEPGLFPPQKLQQFIQRYSEPIVVTAHHTIGLNNLYPLIDGVVIHDESQISSVGKPWNYTVIPHPALVYPEKDKMELRKKFGLPLDKKIVGTMGFICGTGKVLPLTVYNILSKLNSDEFLYLITPFWKGGDMGRFTEITDIVNNKLGKSKNFRMDTDFISDEELLNEKMQCCDLMYCWNNVPKNINSGGGQSGSAADIYGARVKMIVKDNQHFSHIAKQDKVLKGREKPEEFAIDVINALRNENLEDVQNPEWLSWQEQVKSYLKYFEELAL